MSTRISKGTHRFWEAMAILAGIFLILHGSLSLIFLDQIFIFRFLSGAEISIGLATIIIDGWFLRNI